MSDETCDEMAARLLKRTLELSEDTRRLQRRPFSQEGYDELRGAVTQLQGELEAYRLRCAPGRIAPDA